MFRNLFRLFAGLVVGVTAASAATPPPTDRSLEQRVQDAQRVINALMTDEQGGSDQEIAWNNWKNYGDWNDWKKNWHKWHKWNDWNNWHDWKNGWGNHWNNY